VRRVIDAHHHLWELAAREHRWLMGGQAWATDDELARLPEPGRTPQHGR